MVGISNQSYSYDYDHLSISGSMLLEK